MFETSVVRARAASPRRRAEMLAASLAAHSLAAAAIVFAGITSVEMPTQAPLEVVEFAPVFPVVPPAPAPPGEPRTSLPEKPAEPRPVVAPVLLPTPVAPVTIPDAVPRLESANTSEPAAGAFPGEGGEPGVGSPDGIPGGAGDQPGNGLGAGVGQPGAPLDPTGEVRAAQILHRVMPNYPPVALRAGISGTVKIRCIIDRQGRIRDPQVIASTFPAFDEPALEAVQQWRFAPGSLRGRPVDTWFELTVRFNVRR
ncbi:MAG TPA: TonB family protein [Thermoanaerobaculia bacterium]|nr:TonB family protein [Thermoanaerobaculia bacterium]